MPLSNTQTTILGVAALAVAAVVVFAILVSSYTVPTYGVIRTVGCQVYADENATLLVSHVNWGTISPGGYSETTLYVKSTGNVPATLTLNASEWDPLAAEPYINLTTSYQGEEFTPDEVKPLTMQLHVADNITGVKNFTFTLSFILSG